MVERMEKGETLKIVKRSAWVLSVFLLLCIGAYMTVSVGLKADLKNCREMYIDCVDRYNSDCILPVNGLLQPITLNKTQEVEKNGIDSFDN
jgi:hypothetical protein